MSIESGPAQESLEKRAREKIAKWKAEGCDTVVSEGGPVGYMCQGVKDE